MKTVTMRIDDDTYRLFKNAADGQRRNLSNFLEFACLQYLNTTQYVDAEEMEEILSDKDLVASLKQGLRDVEEGNYKIV